MFLILEQLLLYQFTLSMDTLLKKPMTKKEILHIYDALGMSVNGDNYEELMESYNIDIIEVATYNIHSCKSLLEKANDNMIGNINCSTTK